MRDAQTIKKLNFSIGSDGATFPQPLPPLPRTSGGPVSQTKMVKVPESEKTKKNRKTKKNNNKNTTKKTEKTKLKRKNRKGRDGMEAVDFVVAPLGNTRLQLLNTAGVAPSLTSGED